MLRGDPVFDRSEVVAEGEPSPRRRAAEDSPHRRSLSACGGPPRPRRQIAASTRRLFVGVFAVRSSAFGRAARQAAGQGATGELMPTPLSDCRRQSSIPAGRRSPAGSPRMARSYDDAVSRVRRPLLAVSVAALLLGGCAGGGGHDIVLGQVGRADVNEIVEAPATVVARARGSVTSPANGTIARLSVKEGQQVRAGQLLLEIDSPESQEQLAQAEQAHDAAMSGAAISVPPADLSQTQAATDSAATAAFAQARRAAGQIPDRATRDALLAQAGP